MRKTATHLYFHGSVFSNWAATEFDGQVALVALLSRFDDELIGYAHVNPDDSRTIAAHRFSHGEQWLMAAKAWFFGDGTTLRKILEAGDPKSQKALGRDVKPFDEDVWRQIDRHIAVAGHLAKFSANPRIRRDIEDTRGLILVEGSPSDKRWGVGISWRDAAIEDEANWRGDNLLGKTLMEARDLLLDNWTPRLRRPGGKIHPDAKIDRHILSQRLGTRLIDGVMTELVAVHRNSDTIDPELPALKRLLKAIQASQR